MNIETERLNSVNIKRNKIWALMKKNVDEGNLEKADKIREHNYGKIKYYNQKHRFDSTVKSFINHEIIIMLDTEKPTELVLENLNFHSWVKKLPKHIKRKLSGWIKGYIQQRLEYIASLRQIRITKVNPAYTSQLCHFCGAFGIRTNNIFKCTNCGTMNADSNASHNIRARKDDSEITVYTPYKEVKRILLNRIDVNTATLQS